MNPTNVVGRRVGAHIIDVLFCSVIGVIAWFALTTQVDGPCLAGGVDIGGNCRGFETGSSNQGLWFLIDIVVGLTVFWILPAVKGTSPGHAALGLRIIGRDGGTPGLGKGIVRYLLWIVDLFPYFIPGLVAFITASTDKAEHRRVGDRVAGTLVVDKQYAGQPVAGMAPPQYGEFGAQPFAGQQFSGPPSPPQQQQVAVPAGGNGAAAAGWYDDPQGQARLRWWDGSNWTEHTNA